MKKKWVIIKNASKKVVVVGLTICLTITPFSLNVLADENANTSAATAAGNTSTVDAIISQYKFTYPQGHGFAAEQGNNLIDKIKGKNTQVVGDNNVKNGPDRKILNRDGSTTLIQDKYYSTANESINACFDETGTFRYLDADGNVMQIEVPRDQFDAAVLKMKDKISEGKVPGVSDPEEASSIVRKGNLTYEQAKNLAKAGTLESLKYDAVNGVISAGCAFGITIKKDFFDFLAERDYSLSYKMPFLLSVLKHMNEIGDAKIEDVLDDYIAFYEDRITRGLPVDRPTCNYNEKTLADRKFIRNNMLTNPFEKFERKRFLYYSKNLGMISMNHALFSKMDKGDYEKVRNQMEEDLKSYYLDMGI